MKLIKNITQLEDFLQISVETNLLFQIEISQGLDYYKITGSIFNYYFSYSGKLNNHDVFANNMFIQHVIMDCFENLGFKIILDVFDFDFIKIDGTSTFSFGISNYKKGGEEE